MARASTPARISRASGRADVDWALLQSVGGTQELVEGGDVRATG
jgi:hypothetical protein